MDSDNEYLEVARTVIDKDMIELYTRRYQEGRNQVVEIDLYNLSRDLSRVLPRAIRRARITNAAMEWLRDE